MQRLKSLSSLQIALLVSVALHAALLLMHVAAPAAFDRILHDSPLEVVLVNASSRDAPAKPEVIAQRNLAGGGETDGARATSPLPVAPLNAIGDSVTDAQRLLEQMQEQQVQLLAQVKRDLAAFQLSDPSRNNKGDPTHAAEEERHRQLLMLLAQIEKRINAENARPRRRFVSPAAREGVHALYYDTLRHRIEDVGTRNFPEANGQKLYGELSMLIAIDASGKVVSTDIITGSGNRVLDRRALSIARAAGPFGPFTAAMRNQFDQLVFVSRFRFTRNDGLQANVEDTSSH
ncbi:energy transducer TonB [Leptothrix ochracea]|uniref:energy transducer TonB n=1 Tax=Leptothrix ochracea TaxID=735331 RepID=UPI0034E254B0